MPDSTLETPRLVLSAIPPDLPPGLRGMEAPCYLHRTPAWKIRAFLTVALVPMLAGVVWVLREVVTRRADAAELAMGAFLMLSVWAVLRPSTWRPQVSLAADVRGLFFLGSDQAATPVFVPWAEVGELTIGFESAGHEGRARSVIVPIADASAFWAPAKASRFMRHFIGTPDAQGRRGVPIGNVGLRPEDTLEALQAIRAAASAMPASRLSALR